MATLAAYFRRPFGALEAAVPQDWIDETDPYALRPLPCEDVYFFTKKIENRVAREADPRENRYAWRFAGSLAVLLVITVVLLAPKAMGLAASRQLQALKTEHQKLLIERDALELEESRILSPQRMQELAQSLKLEDPAPAQVHLLNPRPNGSVAWNLAVKKQ